MIVGAWACALLFAVSAPAEPATDLETLREERNEVLERYFVRKLTQKRLDTAIEFLEAGDYAAARDKLDRLNFPRLNPYERALAYRFLAYAAIGQEDTPAAIGYFQKVVAEEVLPIDDEASIRFNIAQLYASIEEWDQVEETLQAWFGYVEDPNAVAYYLLAIAHYQRGNFAEALPPALQAVERSERPQERWLQLLAALYLNDEDFESAVPVLEELVIRFAKKDYWLQLSLVYGVRGDYPHALRVQQLAYAQGLLTKDDELRRLARSYLFQDLPYPAARVLERGLEEGRIEADREALELLGNAWIAARDYDESIEPLQRAAELAEDGRLYLRLGQVRVQREDWKQATVLIQKALQKGGLQDLGKAQLLLGISYFSDDRPGLARTAFRQARDHESTRAEANAWLEHIARQSQDG